MIFNRIYFDTNFYRELTLNLTLSQIETRFSNFAKVCLEKNIDSHIHIYVIFELLSHLSSPSDPSFNNCRNAILAINHHCRDSNTREFKYINDIDSELIKYFFNQERNETDEVYDKCSLICDYILSNHNDYYLEEIRPDLKIFTSVVFDIEKNFIRYYEALINEIDSSTKDWHLNKNDKLMRRRNLRFLNSIDFIKLLAREEVQRLSSITRKKITEEEVLRFAKFILENYKFPLLIKVEIIRRIIEIGYNLSKKDRSNWFWDIQIASCVTTNKYMNFIPYIFVTSDQGILKIADKNNLRDRVLSKKDYFKLLQIDL